MMLKSLSTLSILMKGPATVSSVTGLIPRQILIKISRRLRKSIAASNLFPWFRKNVLNPRIYILKVISTKNSMVPTKSQAFRSSLYCLDFLKSSIQRTTVFRTMTRKLKNLNFLLIRISCKIMLRDF
jgi:hypothetical protein